VVKHVRCVNFNSFTLFDKHHFGKQPLSSWDVPMKTHALILSDFASAFWVRIAVQAVCPEQGRAAMMVFMRRYIVLVDRLW